MPATPENIGVYVTSGDDGVEKYILSFSLNKVQADLDASAYDPANPTSPSATVARSWARPLVAAIAGMSAPVP